MCIVFGLFMIKSKAIYVYSIYIFLLKVKAAYECSAHYLEAI